MFNDNKYKVSLNELDHLLNQAFLELDFTNPKNETIMQAISKQVMFNDNYTLVKTKTSKINFKLLSLVAAGIIIAITAVLIYKPNSENSPKVNSGLPVLKNENNAGSGNAVIQEEIVPAQVEHFIHEQPLQNNGNEKRPLENITNLLDEVKDSTKKEEVLLIVSTDMPGGPFLKVQKNEDSAYVFPKLTEKEIKVNAKQKKRMLDALMKFSKDKYALIPMGTFNYKSETVSLHPFYIQTKEVTNLEYRTFLFDLLIQGRKEEFLKAKPDQQQWVKEFDRLFLQPMADNYFSHVAYNSYPVVNITREGAEMYCVWLSKEVNSLLNEKEKPLMNDVRLPSDAEWTYAASGGIKDAIYPWWPLPANAKYFKDGNYIRNARGCFLANFCLKKYTQVLDSIGECNNNKHKDAYTTAGYMVGHLMLVAPVDAYNPNDYGLYCMSGNVAEMVKVTDLRTNKVLTIGTKGGGWNSDEQHLKLNSEDEYAGKSSPSPFIGFRPVISANSIK